MLVRPFAIFAFVFYDFPHKSQIKAARKINPQQKHTNKKSKTKLRVGNWWLMMDHEVIGKLKWICQPRQGYRKKNRKNELSQSFVDKLSVKAEAKV